MSMLDVVVEYDRIDTTYLERSVRGLEREGYQVWIDIPMQAGETPQHALARRTQDSTGLYAIYSEGPIGLEDVTDAIEEFDRQVNHDVSVDDSALTLFACLRGAPDFPATFQKVCADDLRTGLSSQATVTPIHRTKSAPMKNTAPVSAPTPDSSRSTVFNEVMKKRQKMPVRGYGADSQDAPRGTLSINLQRKTERDTWREPVRTTLPEDGSPIERDIVPSNLAKAPMKAKDETVAAAPAAESTAAAAAPNGRNDFIPPPSYTAAPDTEQLAPQPRFRPSLKAPTASEMLHTLSGLALAATFITFVMVAMFFAGAKNMTAGSVATTALLCALAPLLLFFALKSVESRVRQTETPSGTQRA